MTEITPRVATIRIPEPVRLPDDPLADARSMVDEMYADKRFSIRPKASEPPGKTADEVPDNEDPAKPPSRSWLYTFLRLEPKDIRPAAHTAGPAQPVFIITDAENGTSREVSYRTIKNRYELRKKNAAETYSENSGHLTYLIGKTMGKTPEEAGYSISRNGNFSGEPVIARIDGNPGEQSQVRFSELTSSLERWDTSFDTTIRNLTGIYGSRSRALEEYISHETRLGSSAREAFSKRENKLIRQAERIRALEEHPDAASWRIKSRLLWERTLAETRKPLWYGQAILRSALSVAVYDYNPLRILGEQTLGRAWKAELPTVDAMKYRVARTMKDSRSARLSGLAKKILESGGEKDLTPKSLRDYAAGLEKSMLIDPVTGRGESSGPIRDREAREAFFGGIALAMRMNAIPTVLSTLPVIRQLNLKPSEIWSMMRSVRMVEGGVGSVRHFVDTLKKTENPDERTKLIAGAVFAAPMFYFMEKYSPQGLNVNPVLMADMGLMRFVGLSQKYGMEHGLEQTGHLRMMEAIETGITGAFAAESASVIAEKVSKADIIRALVHEVSDPDILNRYSENSTRNILKPLPEDYAQIAKAYKEMPANPDYKTMSQLVTEACDTYERTTGKKPVWVASDAYRDWDTIGSDLGIKDPLTIKDRAAAQYKAENEILIEDAISTLQPELRDLINKELHYNYQNWNDLSVSPSPNGLDGKLKSEFPQYADNRFIRTVSKHIPVNSTQYQFVDWISEDMQADPRYTADKLLELGLIQTEFRDANSFIEKTREQTGRPVDISTILSHFIERTDGRIDQGLWLTSQYLEFRARNDFVTGKYANIERNTEWYVRNIDDTLSVGPKWNELGKLSKDIWDVSPEYAGAKNMDVVNQVGLGYHELSELALLSHAPPELIELMVAGRQQSVYLSHGEMKTRADLQHVRELADAQKELMKYMASAPSRMDKEPVVPEATPSVTMVLGIEAKEITNSLGILKPDGAGSMMEKYMVYGVLRNFIPESTPDEMAGYLDRLQKDRSCEITVEGTPMRFSLRTLDGDVDTVTVSPVKDAVPTGDILVNVSVPKPTEPIMYRDNQDTTYGKNEISTREFMDLLDHLPSSEQVGYFRTVYDAATSNRFSDFAGDKGIKPIIEAFHRHDATADGRSPLPSGRTFTTPWGTISYKYGETGRYEVTSESSEPFTLTIDQVTVLNKVYDDIYMRILEGNTEQSNDGNVEIARKQASRLLHVVLENGWNESGRLFDQNPIIPETDADVIRDLVPDSKDLVPLKDSSHGFLDPTVYPLKDGLTYVNSRGNRTFDASSENATILDNADGTYDVAFVSRVNTSYVTIPTSVWIMHAENKPQAEFISAMASNNMMLEDYAMKTSVYGEKAYDEILRDTWDGVNLLTIGNHAKTPSGVILSVLERVNPDAAKNGKIIVYNGTSLIPLSELDSNIDQGKGYRLLVQSPDVANKNEKVLIPLDNGSGLYSFDIVYSKGEWRTIDIAPPYAAKFGRYTYAGEIPERAYKELMNMMDFMNFKDD